MTMHQILFYEIKRILKFAGKELKSVSTTEDGIIADFAVRGQTYRMFLCKKKGIQEKIDYVPA